MLRLGNVCRYQAVVNTERRHALICVELEMHCRQFKRPWLLTLTSVGIVSSQRRLVVHETLSPAPLGDDLAFLFLSPSAYPELVLWGDVKSAIEIAAFRIPEVECWFPRDVPLSAVEHVLLLMLRRF